MLVISRIKSYVKRSSLQVLNIKKPLVATFAFLMVQVLAYKSLLQANCNKVL